MTYHSALALLANVLLLSTTAAQAQVRFNIGPKASLQTTSVQLTGPFPSLSKIQSQSGHELGLVATIGWKHLAIQPALLLSQKGYCTFLEYGPLNKGNGMASISYQVRFNYLTLPLHVVYTQRTTGQGYQLFAGPYLALLNGGRYERRDTYGGAGPDDYQVGPVMSGEQPAGSNALYAEQLDAGLQAGIGYQYKGLLVQGTASLGLRNVGVNEGLGGARLLAGSSYTNYAFQAALSYLFGPHD
jgi:hypothetical protein